MSGMYSLKSWHMRDDGKIEEFLSSLLSLPLKFTEMNNYITCKSFFSLFCEY